MVAAINQRKGPLSLAVTGEAKTWQPALEQIVGPRWLITYQVRGQRELIDVVRSGLVDAAVLDEEADWDQDLMQMLRLIRRIDRMLPVVVLSRQADRRWLEAALSLTVLSVVPKPLELEPLLRQIARIMAQLDAMLRSDARR